LFHLPVAPETLRGLNLLLHSVAGVLLFLVLLRLLRGSAWKTFSAFVGTMFFIFNPAGLWYFSNTYGWDFFWHFLWVISLFIFIRFLDGVVAKRVSPALWIALFVSVFCLAYAEFQGAFCAGTYFFYLVSRRRKNRDYTRAAVLVACSVALAIGLTLVQYSRISGFDALMGHYGNALSRRCLLNPTDHLRVLLHYVIQHLFVLVPLGFMSALVWTSGDGYAVGRSDRGLWRSILVLTAVPVVLHHLIFLEWTAVHSYSAVKAIIPLTILIVVPIDRVMGSGVLRRSHKSLVFGLILACLTASVAEYRLVYSYSRDADRFRRVGKEISQLAATDEVVFLASEVYELFQVTYYSKRNHRKVYDAEDAKQWMREHGRTRGILFSTDHDYNLVGVTRLQIDDGPAPR